VERRGRGRGEKRKSFFAKKPEWFFRGVAGARAFFHLSFGVFEN
jgi:hypothetical protein